MVMPGDNTEMIVELIHPIAVEQGDVYKRQKLLIISLKNAVLINN